MPRWLKITGIGCGGLAVLFVVFVAGFALGSATTEGVPPPLPTDPVPSAQDAAPGATSEPRDEPGDSSRPDTAIIRVSGDAPFSCNIGSLDESRSVEGVPPQEYEIPVDTGAFDYESISAFCWKSGVPGTVAAEIIYDGEVRKSASTSTEYGNLNVRWSPTG